MLSSGFRRAFGNVSRFGSSSERLDQPTTDETTRKETRKLHAPPETYVSEEGALVYSSDNLASSPWRVEASSSRNKQTPAIEPHLDKHLPRIPVQPNTSVSQTGLFDGIPHLASNVAESLKVDLEPLVDHAPSGLLLDKLARDPSSTDDTTSMSDSVEDNGSTNQRRMFLDRRLVDLSIADSNISSIEDDSFINQSVGPDPTGNTEQESVPPSVQLEVDKSDLGTQQPTSSSEQDLNAKDHNTQSTKRSKTSFSSFLHKLASAPITEPIASGSSSSSQNIATQDTFLSVNLAPSKDLASTGETQSDDSPPTHPLSSSEDDDKERKKRRKRPQNTFLMLQPIVESGDSLLSSPPKPSSSTFTPSTLGVDSSFAKKMEETGRLRRLQSQQSIVPSSKGLKPLILSSSVSQSPNTSDKPALNGSAHAKSRSEADVLNVQSIPTPSVPPSRTVLDKVPRLSTSDDQDALHDFLERTLRELEEAQKEAARIKAQSVFDKTRLEEQLKEANDELQNLRNENQLQKAEIADFEKQLKSREKDVLRLSTEKQHWQEQLDTMQHRLNQADRQIRCLDHLTRSKLESRAEGVYGPTRRAKLAAPSRDPSSEVISALGALNDEILQSANLLVENLERTNSSYPTSGDWALARTTLGNKLTRMLQAQANDKSKVFRFLLMQVVLEVFMVQWCTNIIEGWYPKQQSFADLLIEMHSKTVSSSAPRIDCGKVKLIDTNTLANVTLRYGEWAADVLRDLGKILSVAGLRMRPNRTSLFTSKLLSLVKMAYDVRTALAEKDICGDLDLSVVGPDLPFQPRWMEEAHAMSRHQLGATVQMEPIVGTCGMGLKRNEVKKGNISQQDYAVVLKPKVVLARVLEESL